MKQGKRTFLIQMLCSMTRNIRRLTKGEELGELEKISMINSNQFFNIFPTIKQKFRKKIERPLKATRFTFIFDNLHGNLRVSAVIATSPQRNFAHDTARSKMHICCNFISKYIASYIPLGRT